MSGIKQLQSMNHKQLKQILLFYCKGVNPTYITILYTVLSLHEGMKNYTVCLLTINYYC